MKLYWSSRSPFARKVVVAARELGLFEQLVLVPAVVSILKPDASLLTVNPLGMIPALALEDGSVLQDSLVICDYLDMLAPSPRLFPQRQPERAQALARHATALALTDTLVRWFGERRRVEDPLQPAYVAAFRLKLNRTLDHVEARCAQWPDQRFDIGDMAFAVLLAYADFRFGEENWRAGRAALARWFDAVSQRESMQHTAFTLP